MASIKKLKKEGFFVDLDKGPFKTWKRRYGSKANFVHCDLAMSDANLLWF